jgi:flagellar biosynthesis/type III secretory pathway protein FliH
MGMAQEQARERMAKGKEKGNEQGREAKEKRCCHQGPAVGQ